MNKPMIEEKLDSMDINTFVEMMWDKGKVSSELWKFGAAGSIPASQTIRLNHYLSKRS